MADITAKIAELCGAITARNELEKQYIVLQQKREDREYVTRIFLISAVLVLAGVRVVELAGII